MRETEEEKIKTVAAMIKRSKRVVVFTGAGVSTESGIPDFRSAGGIWSKFNPDDFTIQRFKRDRGARKKHWKMLIHDGLFANASPNKAHRAIAELERLRKLDCVITQNIDNLHQRAGNSPDKVFELHGNMESAECLDCGERHSLNFINDKLRQGIEDPECERCGGILKPGVVLFGEALPEDVMEAAIDRSIRSDLFIVIGSSLVVYPAAFIPGYAKDAGARLVIINMTPTLYDDRADICIRAKAGAVMEKIIITMKEKIRV